MLTRRLVATAIVAIWLVLVYLVFLPIREDLSHTYHHIIDATTELPALTKDYSLRILGTGDYLSEGNERDWLFYLFWGFVGAFPVFILLGSWMIKTPLHLLEFLLYSWAFYFTAVASLFTIALYGLILPFLHL